MNNYTNNFTGSHGTQIAQGSPGTSMHSTVKITDDHRQQLLAVTCQIAEQVNELPSEEKPAATEALSELKAAVGSPVPDKNRLRAAFEKIAIAAITATGTEAGKNIVTLAGEAIRSIGS